MTASLVEMQLDGLKGGQAGTVPAGPGSHLSSFNDAPESLSPTVRQRTGPSFSLG